MALFFPPWVVSDAWFKENGIEAFDALEAWKQVAMRLYVLEERISPAIHSSLPEDIAAKYLPVWSGPSVWIADEVMRPSYTDQLTEPVGNEVNDGPVAYWIDLAQLPPSERVRYPSLPEELNLKEAESVMESIELYVWRPEKMRFILRNRAWKGEG